MATKDWKKIQDSKHGFSYKRKTGEKVQIEKLDDLYYLRTYDKNDFLTDSLAEGSMGTARYYAKEYMRKN